MVEAYFIFLLLSFLFFVGLKVLSIYKRTPQLKGINIQDVAFVVPFRNEEKNLPSLLNTIAAQKSFPQEIIFVNDHSTDASNQIINAFIEQYEIGCLQCLRIGSSGKKAALNLGIQSAKSRYIVTLDADVILHQNYVQALSGCRAYHLSVFPVVMSGKNLKEKLFSTEYLFFNAFNFLLSPVWPISASGANLFFDTKAVNYESQLYLHEHLASGDDFFLLKEMRKNKTSIHVENSPDLSVETNAPDSLSAYLNQRVRWLSKSSFQVEGKDLGVGFFISLYFMGGIIALIAAAIQWQWIAFISVFMLRFLLDAFVYLNYAQRLRITKNVFYLPFFQLFYPFLFMTVVVLSSFYRPTWKGRK